MTLPSANLPSALSTSKRPAAQRTRKPSPELASPAPAAATASSKLAALHARLNLSSRLPLQNLARSLVDSSANPSPYFNNAAFAALGNDLLAYYTSEYIICRYPRLPLAVVYAAMYAYVGPAALSAIKKEWGVESAAYPGGEVDAGLLQFERMPPESDVGPTLAPLVTTAPEPGSRFRRNPISSRTVYNDQFGESPKPVQQSPELSEQPAGVTEEMASASFIRALVGAIYLHNGRKAAKVFFREHFMSRQLNVSTLFNFRHPQRDLSRLCAREGFQAPVARLLSETGRKSRHPVFLIGVYSGQEKLGEGVGASLDEARTCAAVAALKGWYLYSPPELRVPSETEEPDAPAWEPAHVDFGDIVI